jgi:hypothetical protein
MLNFSAALDFHLGLRLRTEGANTESLWSLMVSLHVAGIRLVSTQWFMVIFFKKIKRSSTRAD